MALYAYRCPAGGEEVAVMAKFGLAPEQVHCSQHDTDCYRLFNTAALILHGLRDGYYIPKNRKTDAQFVKQEERRGHDVRGRY